MKIFRFEHKATKRGMFTSNLNGTKYSDRQDEIRTILMDHYNSNPSDLMCPIDEFRNVNGYNYYESDSNKLQKLFSFYDYIESGAIFGCDTLEKVSGWFIKDKDVLDKMLKCGYFLYEIEIKDDAEFYKLETQILFKRQDIIKSKVMHAKSVLKEFFK